MLILVWKLYLVFVCVCVSALLMGLWKKISLGFWTCLKKKKKKTRLQYVCLDMCMCRHSCMCVTFLAQLHIRISYSRSRVIASGAPLLQSLRNTLENMSFCVTVIPSLFDFLEWLLPVCLWRLHVCECGTACCSCTPLGCWGHCRSLLHGCQHRKRDEWWQRFIQALTVK